LRDLRAHGVLAAELGSTHSPEQDLAAALRDDFADFALITHNFFPPPDDASIVINLSDPRMEARAGSIELARSNIRFASAVGSRLHTVHPGFLAVATTGVAANRMYDFHFDPSLAVPARQALRW